MIVVKSARLVWTSLAAITYVLASHKEVCGLSAKACTHTNLHTIDRGKGDACSADFVMFKVLLYNQTQILERIYVSKGGTAT
jgi:hypothetical protein